MRPVIAACFMLSSGENAYPEKLREHIDAIFIPLLSTLTPPSLVHCDFNDELAPVDEARE